MGADIYLRIINDPEQELYKPHFQIAIALRDNATTEDLRREAQEQVDECYDLMYGKGYFRDSYNSSNLLQTMGLSWWIDAGGRLDEDGHMAPAHCQTLLDEIYKRFPAVDWVVWYGLNEGSIAEDSDLADWITFFRSKYERFTSLLRQAIDLDEGLDCSV